MAVFYVDAIGGLDTNSGNSIYSPLKTIAQVNTLLAARTIGSGDSVLFKRGQTHYGRLNSTPAPAGVWQADITFSSYDRGHRPIISGYKRANTNGWAVHASGVWKIDITATSTSITGDLIGTGAIGQMGTTDVGFLKVAGKMLVRKFRDLASLGANQWDFTSDAQYLYVRSDGDPATLASEILIATRGNSATPATRTKYLGLEVIGTGSHGFRSDTASFVEIIGCSIREHGGSYLNIPAKGDGTFDNTRFGNGVEVWINQRQWLVEHNDISDIYDVAVTCQGTSFAADTLGFTDIVFRYNRITNCSQAFECWGAKGTDGSVGPGFVRVKFLNNTIYNSGFSWGEAVPTNSGSKGVAFLSYAMDLPTDIEVAHNLVVGAKASLSYHRRLTPAGGLDTTTVPPGWNSHDNTIMLTSGTKMRFVLSGSGHTIDNAATYVAAEQTETGSTFHVLPASLDPAVVGKQAWLATAERYVHSRTATALERTRISERAVAAVAADVAELQAAAVAATPKGRQAGTLQPASWYFPPHTNDTVEMVGSTNTYSFRGLPFRPTASGYISKVAIQIMHASDAGGGLKVAVYRMEAGTLIAVYVSPYIPGTTVGVVQADAGFRVREGEELWVGAAINGANVGALGIRGTRGDFKNGIPLPDNALAWAFDNRPVGISVSAPLGNPPATAPSFGATTIAPIVALRAA